MTINTAMRAAALAFLAAAIVLNAFAPDAGHYSQLIVDGATAATGLAALFTHPPGAAAPAPTVERAAGQ